MCSLCASHLLPDVCLLKMEWPQTGEVSTFLLICLVFVFVCVHFLTIFLYQITFAESNGAHSLLFLADTILYMSPCLHFREDNSINPTKDCISKSDLFVWRICIIKLAAEGSLTFLALSDSKIKHMHSYISKAIAPPSRCPFCCLTVTFVMSLKNICCGSLIHVTFKMCFLSPCLFLHLPGFCKMQEILSWWLMKMR